MDLSFPAAKPHEFDLTGVWGDTVDPNVQKADAQVRGYLTAARFPKAEGSALAQEVNKVSRELEHAAPAAREIYARNQEAALRRTWGDSYDKRLAIARQLVAELDARTPGLKALLDASGAGNSAMVINLLAGQAERLLMRRGEKL
jgi:hypothetical protein